jgi:anti-sigma factor RsiW
MKHIAEDDLHAYVDGQLDEARRIEVEAWLAKHPEEQRKVADWQQQNDMIGTLYGHVGEEAFPPRLQPQAIVLPKSPARQGWQLLAAVLVLTIAGGAIGWFGRGLVEPQTRTEIAANIVEQAINAHALYSVEVLHPVEVAANEEQHLVKWLSKRLGEKIAAPDLTGEGFSLIGGRLLPATSGPAAQFMYEDKSGRRLTLYAARNAGKNLASFQSVEKNGLQAFYWLTSDLSYALVGKVTRQQLQTLSRKVYEQLT